MDICGNSLFGVRAFGYYEVSIAPTMALTQHMLALRKPEAPWISARRPSPSKLQFGRMYEDSVVERSAFRPGGKIFCIGGSGCIALALAERGDEVTAVDHNPAQADYISARIAGAPVSEGAMDRSLASIRKALPWLGLSPSKLRTFLSLSDPIDQIHYWRNQLDTAAWRGTVDHALRQGLFRTLRAKDVAQAIPSRFGMLLRRRLERSFALHANAENPFLWRLLLDCEPPAAEPKTRMQGLRIEVSCQDALEYLEGCATGTFDGFSLSHMLDSVDASYRRRVLVALRRTGTSRSIIVTRSFAEPTSGATNNLAGCDRSPFWGVVRVEPLATVNSL